ncbi:rhodanese-related sulfurtransferase [Pelotomaculum thermopropionicum SI]|uniref:thiosulfate sulfurtransferase n=1 Tax=Pelotomaculum thermopropionicum (strain DSM 13744 / JCM 10971 / SI) TaxID=370438 RepID=A5D3B1_PELTS|nr:rhodanese-related sulfurtransferase [Pelotomaculum thermopropionicum SI]
MRRLYPAGLAAVLFILAAATILIAAGCYHKTAAPVPVTVEEKKEDPLPRLAAEEKIAGYARPGALISVYELSRRLDDPGTFIIDTRGRSFKVLQASYPAGHIPGAVPALHSNYCHPTYQGRIGTPLQLQDFLGRLGAGTGNEIILYGNDGLQARLYWALKMYGYDQVRILDGGLDKWKEAGFDVAIAATRRPPGTFEFDLAGSKAEQMMATAYEVAAAIGNSGYVIIDARRNDEYLYKHIPGSINLSSEELFNQDRTFKPAHELRALAESKKITPDKKILVYSNSGVRSSLVWFALSELLGYPEVKNYDGSLQEWVKLERETEKGLQTARPEPEKRRQ